MDPRSQLKEAVQRRAVEVQQKRLELVSRALTREQQDQLGLTWASGYPEFDYEGGMFRLVYNDRWMVQVLCQEQGRWRELVLNITDEQLWDQILLVLATYRTPA